MGIHAAYAAIYQAGHESDDSTANKALYWIDSLMREAFTTAKEAPLPFGGLKLNGADPAERVTEALAVWLCESDPERFRPILAGYDNRLRLPPHLRLDLEQWEAAERKRDIAERDESALRTLAGAYAVESVDDSADGMERLRNQDQFILLCYPRPDDKPADLLAALLADLDSCMRPDGFSHDSAGAAVRLWYHYEGGQARLASACAEALELPPPECEDMPDESCLTFRLYVKAPSPELAG